ncbi:hypothetical protein TWF694_007235 [Orbilia ellipsospora]|uniref:Uncharacterized protein n=1 Tax=Orbilia ellipsospora TaxID=2528407 RepID=A0AAV9XJT6_9PEZI
MRLVTVKHSTSALILYALVVYSLPSGNRAGPVFERLELRVSEAIPVTGPSKRQSDTFISRGLNDLDLSKRHEGISNFANFENLKRGAMPESFPDIVSHHHEESSSKPVKTHGEVRNREVVKEAAVDKRDPVAASKHIHRKDQIHPDIKEKIKAAISERKAVAQANANLKRSYQHKNPLQGYDNTLPPAAYSADDSSFAHSISKRKAQIEPEQREPHAVRRAILDARLKELGYNTPATDQEPDNDTLDKKHIKRDAESTLPDTEDNEDAPKHHLKKRDFDPHIGCPSLRLMNSGGSIFFNPDYFKARMAEFRNACFKCGCKAKRGTWSMFPRSDWGCTDRLVMNCILLGCMCVPDSEADAKWLMPKPAWEAKSPATTSTDNHYSFEIYDPLKDISYGDRYSAEADVYETPLGTGLKRRDDGEEKRDLEEVSRVPSVFETKRDALKA